MGSSLLYLTSSVIWATFDRFSAGIDLKSSTDLRIIVFSKVEYMVNSFEFVSNSFDGISFFREPLSLAILIIISLFALDLGNCSHFKLFKISFFFD